VSEPDYGNLWESTHYEAINNRAEVPASDFLQPRMEAEVVFLIGKPLRGPHALRPAAPRADDDAVHQKTKASAPRQAP